MFDRDLEMLLARIADSDEAALADLYDKTNRLLFSLLLKMLGDNSQAEDALANVYIEIWKQAASYQTQNSPALSWLISLARSFALEEARFKINSGAPGELPESICSEIFRSENVEGDFISERQKIVSSVLEKMPLPERRTLELAYFSCLNQKEIAERLDQPLEEICMLLQKGMNFLREELTITR
jgi:RNA polymerase sigma-70 factor (ECF subfamily)